MTCITAVVKNGHVYMAGDLMGSNGFTKKVYPDTKVFKNGDFLIGYTSSFRMGQILQYNWNQPPRLEGMSDREYLQTDVIESMRQCFNDYGFGEFKDGEHQGGTFLIGYKGNLYEMQSNFSILKNEHFAAVGSGQYHAEAVLYLATQEEDFDPENVLATAIHTASIFTTSVSEDCTIVTTDEEYKLAHECEDEFVPSEDGVDVTEDTHSTATNTDVPKQPRVLWQISTESFGSFCIREDGEIINPESTMSSLAVIPCSTYGFTDEYCIDFLKEAADSLGVKYAHNISATKLCERLNKKVQEMIDSHGDS